MARSPSASPALGAALHEAAHIVARVAAGRSLSMELEQRAARLAPGLRPVVLDLCYGTLRSFGRVQAIVSRLSSRRRPDPDVEALLWCAITALDSGRYADYAVVNEAVLASARARGQWSPKGYVNALLRAYLRDRSAVDAALAGDLQVKYRHPQWWIERVRAAYPDRWEGVLNANNAHPPMCLRVNRRRVTLEAYAAKLARAGLAARRIGDCGLLLERPVPIEQLPGFAEGEVSVQDASAQWTVHPLDLADGLRVLDACAAPGGKSAHILEAAQVSLTALEFDSKRRALVDVNLARLGLKARVITADCTALRDWWDEVPFDRVLADVPCSASGVARRHPDIKWLRREADIGRFAARQADILDALWRVLARGGKLLYVTCSVFPEENELVVAAFCARTPEARRLILPCGAPAQILPDADRDGFFFALLEKPS